MTSTIRFGRFGDEVTLGQGNYDLLDGWTLSPAIGNAVSRVVSIPLSLWADTWDELYDQVVADLERIIDLIEPGYYSTQPSARVRLRVRRGTSEYTDFFVLPSTDSRPNQLELGRSLPSIRVGDNQAPTLLTLHITSVGYRDSVSDDVAGVNGLSLTSPTFYIPDIIGTATAPAELRLTDTSAGNPINGWLIGRKASRSMADADWEPVQEVMPAGSGSEVFDTDARGGASVTFMPNTTWQLVGKIDAPAAALTRGRIRLLLRLRDSTQSVQAPRNVQGFPGSSISLTQAVATPSFAFVGPGGTLSPVWSVETEVGHGLVAGVFMRFEGAEPGITPPAGWQHLASAIELGGSIFGKVHFFVIPNAASRSGAETFQFSQACTARVVLTEWEGLASSPVDQVAESNTGNGDSIRWYSGLTPLLSQENILAIGGIVVPTTTSLDPRRTFGRYHTASNGNFSETLLASGTEWRLNHWMSYAILDVLDQVEFQLDSLNITPSGVPSPIVVAALKGSSPDSGDLPAGTYTYTITSYNQNGIESEPSGSVTVIRLTSGTNKLIWDAPALGEVAGYYVYWSRNGAPYQRFDTGSTDTEYLHTTETGATAAEPPSGRQQTIQWRADIIHPGGSAKAFEGNVTSSLLANGNWEYLDLGILDVPPQTYRLGGSAQDWEIRIWARQESGPLGFGSGTLDFAALLDAREPYLFAYYPGLNFDQHGEWIIGRDEYGRNYCLIEVGGSILEYGQVVGSFALEPGDNKLVMLPLTANGVADLTDITWNADAAYRAAYRSLRGV